MAAKTTAKRAQMVANTPVQMPAPAKPPRPKVQHFRVVCIGDAVATVQQEIFLTGLFWVPYQLPYNNELGGTPRMPGWGYVWGRKPEALRSMHDKLQKMEGVKTSPVADGHYNGSDYGGY